MRRSKTIFIVIILINCVIFTSTAAADLTYGLISHWKLDEPNGVIAYDSAGSNHGAVYGAAWTSGQINGTLDFDGVDDYVALPDNDPIWLPQNNFTLSVWVYFDNPSELHESILDLNFGLGSPPVRELGCLLERRGPSGVVGFFMTTASHTDEDLYSNTALSYPKIVE